MVGINYNVLVLGSPHDVAEELATAAETPSPYQLTAALVNALQHIEELKNSLERLWEEAGFN